MNGQVNYKSALVSIELDLPSRGLMDRILAREDLEFIRKQPPWIQVVFHKERKAVALDWLQEAKHFMEGLFRLHRLVARRSDSLDLALELRTLVDYVSFLVLVSAARCLIQFAGPLHARGTIGRAFNAVDRLAATLDHVVASLDPATRAGIEAEWARRMEPAT